jgi:hypothetical protein
MNHRLSLLTLALLGCAAVEERPACSATALAALESAYVAETLAACAGHQTPEQCPAYPEIKARFESKRSEWEKCQ